VEALLKRMELDSELKLKVPKVTKIKDPG
jgi:hypothetical protein